MDIEPNRPGESGLIEAANKFFTHPEILHIEPSRDGDGLRVERKCGPACMIGNDGTVRIWRADMFVAPGAIGAPDHFEQRLMEVGQQIAVLGRNVFRGGVPAGSAPVSAPA